MADVRNYSGAAVIFLVVLRLGIGWQLLYEGLWKINTQSTPTPWSAEGYLKNAQGPMRDVFRTMAGDPDDKGWLDVDLVGARWDSWKQRFSKHYGLNDSQLGSLTRLIDGSSEYAAQLDALPAGVDFKAAGQDKVIRFDAARKLLLIDGKRHMVPAEKTALEAQIEGQTGPEYDAYRAALAAAYARSSRLSYKERARAHLMGNPDNAGLIDGRISQIELYNRMLDRYQEKLASADLPYQFEHLNRTWSDTRQKASELAGPVMAMDRELQDEALDLLSVDQLKRGPLSDPVSVLKVVDLLTITGLAGLGLLLISGLFTRFAAFSAAMMIFGFYLAMPPLPGVPEAPGPEHSFIVNKNLIEVMALLALACIPSGMWFGLDSVLATFRLRRATLKGAR
ncbi:MAG TPA: hypothetical protein DIT89_11300 [Planctomycetaceae bacterium]|mgnify:FL=1|nr:hypothetical protein [Planctomycetaceae bacterium]